MADEEEIIALRDTVKTLQASNSSLAQARLEFRATIEELDDLIWRHVSFNGLVLSADQKVYRRSADRHVARAKK